MLIQGSSDPPRLVRVGIDAALVAQHEVCRRVIEADGRVRTDRFRVETNKGWFAGKKIKAGDKVAGLPKGK